MIVLNNLCCGYGSKIVLSDVSFTIKKGEMTCLLGRNGAGKTTLFKTILGLLSPMRGSITINGLPIGSLSADVLARQISYVPQAHGNPFPFSVLEVVTMGQFAHSKSLWGNPTALNKRIARECIETLGIEYLAAKQFSKLSGGEKQMVLIARAMAQQPLFIAMDEPTSNLDMGNQHKVMQLADLLRKGGYGLIINTHSPEQAANYADQVVLLNQGKIESVGHPSSVLQSQVLSNLYRTEIELVTARTSTGKTCQVCLAV